MADRASSKAVIEAFNQGIRQVGDEQFAKMSKYQVQLVGEELASHVRGDRASLALPVTVHSESVEDIGALLLLEHRAVVAWSHGVLRKRTDSFSETYANLKNIHLRSVRDQDKDFTNICFDAGTGHFELTVLFAKPTFAAMVKGVLEGSLRPVFAEGAARRPDVATQSKSSPPTRSRERRDPLTAIEQSAEPVTCTQCGSRQNVALLGRECITCGFGPL
jgi:hypothetical protein